MSRRRAPKWRVYLCRKEHVEMVGRHIIVECGGYPVGLFFETFAEAWEYLRAKAGEPA